jgi:Tfp pilus assembly protein PilN
MVIINLLPWRKQRERYERESLRKSLWMSGLLSCVLVALLQWMAGRHLEGLRAHVRELEGGIQTFSTVQRFMQDNPHDASPDSVRKNMLAYQAATKGLFMELGKEYGNSVCFTDITREKNTITFVGNVSSAEDLTDFLKRWNVAQLFSEIKIGYLQQQENRPMRFSFQALEENVQHEL